MTTKCEGLTVVSLKVSVLGYAMYRVKYTLCTVPCSQKPIIGSYLHITGLSCEANFNISLISVQQRRSHPSCLSQCLIRIV